MLRTPLGCLTKAWSAAPPRGGKTYGNGEGRKRRSVAWVRERKRAQILFLLRRGGRQTNIMEAVTFRTRV